MGGAGEARNGIEMQEIVEKKDEEKCKLYGIDTDNVVLCDCYIFFSDWHFRILCGTVSRFQCTRHVIVYFMMLKRDLGNGLLILSLCGMLLIYNF